MIALGRLMAVYGALAVATLSTPVAAAGDDIGLCRRAIATAAAAQAFPPRLLEAISLVESGRPDPATGQWGAWPWTVNAQGKGHFYASKHEAVEAVQALQARGERVIDVGCMQIDLAAHPAAFSSLEEAFDPDANARYAALFLTRLYAELTDWMRAAGAYHSRTPEIGAAYAARVEEAMGNGAAALIGLASHLQTVFGGSALTRYAVALPPASNALPVGSVRLVRTAMDESWVIVPLPRRLPPPSTARHRAPRTSTPALNPHRQ